MHIAIIVYLCYTATILFIPLINEPWRLRNKEVSFLSMFLEKIILMLLQHMQKRTKIRIFFQNKERFDQFSKDICPHLEAYFQNT